MISRFEIVLILIATLIWGFVLTLNPAYGGTLNEVPEWTDPCAEAVLSFSQYENQVMPGSGDTQMLYQMYLGLRHSNCGDAPVNTQIGSLFIGNPEPLPLCQRIGLTDRECLERIFNGDDINPAPVPIPATFWFLTAGLLSLFGLNKRSSKRKDYVTKTKTADHWSQAAWQGHGS